MDVTGAVLRELVKHSRLHQLERFETPGAITLVAEEWTPESGLATAAQKLKRKPIQERYQQDLDRMYKKI
jgi:long-chain acyl-CoA synthetase